MSGPLSVSYGETSRRFLKALNDQQKVPFNSQANRPNPRWESADPRRRQNIFAPKRATAAP